MELVKSKRVKDEDKLLMLAKVYSISRNEIFSAEMLFDFLLNNETKFRKDMNTKRIGHILSNSNLFKKNKRVSNVTYYELKK